MRALLVLLAAVALLASSCGGDDDSEASGDTTTNTTTAAASEPATTAPDTPTTGCKRVDAPAPRDDGGDRNHRWQHVALVPAQQREGDGLEEAGLRDHRDEEREPEYEGHRVRVHELVEAMPGEQVVAQERQPRPPAFRRDALAEMRARPRDAEESGDDDERHAVGEGVLVDAVAKGTEDEEADDGGEDLDRQEPDRQLPDPPREERNQRERRA